MSDITQEEGMEEAIAQGYDVQPHYPHPAMEGTRNGRRYEYVTPQGSVSTRTFSSEEEAWDEVLRLRENDK